jgi:anaerobic ribonucleoside-triphosphate reductase activating protein
VLISGLQKLTLLDYPGRVACTVFTGGCNFRCPFCHNAPLVLPDRLERDNNGEATVLAFLRKRQGILDGVAVTGGEPLLHRDIDRFLTEVKELGFRVKLDTNGSFPDRLRALVERGLVDRVAVDVKNSPARYAEMIGVGMTSDAYHMTAPDPDGKGAERVMRQAIKDAGLLPDQIDFINTHGTSTPLGDVAEVQAIQRVFGDHVYEMNLDSTKSMTGHLIGATGAVEALTCIMALKDGVIPPTINHDPDDVDEQIDYRINFTFGKAQKRNIHYALSNTFGFGGHNACLVFKKWEN